MKHKPTKYQMTSPKVKTSVVKCGVCGGEGIVHRRELHDYHRNSHSYWSEKCSICEGSGRLNLKVTFVYNPYVPSEPVPRSQATID